MTARRTLPLLLGLLTTLLLAGPVLTVPAHAAPAEDGFRYWGYYQWTGGRWVFAQKGADALTPADGAVEGWRFAVSGAATSRPPRATGDFASICAGTPAQPDRKRVAVVVDPGTSADAPAGAGTPPAAVGSCVVTDRTATGAEVLSSAGPARFEKGLACGIDGYPATGCGQAVRGIEIPATEAPVQLSLRPEGAQSPGTAPPGPAGETDDGSVPWTGILVGIVVAVLAASSVLITRRRTTRSGP